MSRIGKLPIELPNGVSVELKENIITVKGPKGELKQEIHPNMKVIIEENIIKVEKPNEEKFNRALHGLTRSLINNMVIGVSEGFSKTLEIVGVGYRAAVSGKKLTLNLGFSHPIDYIAPDGIDIEMDKDKKTILHIKGTDKQLVGKVAAEIRDYKKPEPYKGKGIKYLGEYIRRKAGKTAAK